MGAAFSVVDAYLFTVLGWCKFFSIYLSRWPALPAYVKRVGVRPAVQEAALRAEAVRQGGSRWAMRDGILASSLFPGRGRRTPFRLQDRLLPEPGIDIRIIWFGAPPRHDTLDPFVL